MEGIENIQKFFNLIQKKSSNDNISKNIEYYIDTSWNIPGVGTVIGGHLTSGNIKVGDKLWIGPNTNKYRIITVKSIHCKRVSLQEVKYGSYVCLGVKGISKQDVKKGNVIISNKNQCILCENILVHVEVYKNS